MEHVDLDTAVVLNKSALALEEEGVLLEEVLPHDLGLETLVVVEVPRLHRPVNTNRTLGLSEARH